MNSAFIDNHPFPQHYAKELLVIESGDGVWLTDRRGKKYLDFGSGIAVNALGHGRDDLAETAAAQMKKLIHVSNLYATAPALKLAEELRRQGPFEAVFFGNSGTEANEAALKYARLYSLRVKGEGCHRILSFQGAFHGRTLGALSCTFNPKYQDPFQPLVPGCEAGPFNNCADLESRLDGSFAAVIVEVVQGEGGLTTMSGEFAGCLNRFCGKHDVVLIVDEVQTGLTRTGSLFAHTQIGLKPDIVTLAKPLAGGLPLSATLIPAKINRLLHIGEHGTTFGGGPVTTAVALKVWEMLSDEAFIDQVRRKGEKLHGMLEDLKKKHDFLGEVRGLGLLKGIDINRVDSLSVIQRAREAGLLILRSGENVLRLAPPLTISEEDMAEGVRILDEVLQTESGENHD